MTAPAASTRKFTAETATQFERYSAENAAILESVCPDCQPYVNWLTYNRWLALGMQVQKGQHGVRLMTYVTRPDKDDDKKTYTIPHTVSVFCKHQVAPIETKKEQ